MEFKPVTSINFTSIDFKISCFDVNGHNLALNAPSTQRGSLSTPTQTQLIHCGTGFS
jgi:hypothetical protein